MTSEKQHQVNEAIRYCMRLRVQCLRNRKLMIETIRRLFKLDPQQAETIINVVTEK